MELPPKAAGCADSYTAFGYANPTRRVLASVLHTQAEVVEVEAAGDGEQVPHLRYASNVVKSSRHGCTARSSGYSASWWRTRNGFSPAAWTPTCCTCSSRWWP